MVSVIWHAIITMPHHRFQMLLMQTFGAEQPLRWHGLSSRYAMRSYHSGYQHQTETVKRQYGAFRSGADSKSGTTLLFHCIKAVKYLVSRMAEPSYSPELSLVACLLFICIEFLRGDSKMLARQRQRYKYCQQRISTLPKSSSRFVDNIIAPIYMRKVLSALAFGALVED